MSYRLRIRRIVLVACLIAAISFGVTTLPDVWQATSTNQTGAQGQSNPSLARTLLEQLETKGRAAKTGYSREQFGSGWGFIGICDTRNAILSRDLTNTIRDEECHVLSGTLYDPYTALTIVFARGPDTSPLVQIDHVVALSNAWQTGAQYRPAIVREQFANDPLNLLAVDGKINNQKGDGDAATWLPPNKLFRCQYVARQIAVKKKYELWVTESEKNAMKNVLSTCPDQTIPTAVVPAR